MSDFIMMMLKIIKRHGFLQIDHSKPSIPKTDKKLAVWRTIAIRGHSSALGAPQAPQSACCPKPRPARPPQLSAQLTSPPKGEPAVSCRRTG